MPVAATNLIAGPADLYCAAFGATEPLDTELSTPPLVADWTALGGTSGGVQFTVAREFMELSVDQVVDTPGRRMTKRDFSVATSLAEGTLENLALALGELETSVTAAAGVKSLEPGAADPGEEPNYSAIILDGRAPAGKRRRIIGRKVLSTESVESAYTKDGQTLIPVTFTGHWVSSSIRPFRVVDATA